MAKKTNGKFDVGGVLLAQPFKIRRSDTSASTSPIRCLPRFLLRGAGLPHLRSLDVASITRSATS